MATSFFPSRHRHCPQCSRRRITVNGEEVIEYYHRGVVCHLMGFDLAVPLDVEMVRPGEGEVAAAMRLMERVFRDYPRFFEVVVGDALYMESPFFNFCLDRGKEIIAVLKGNQGSLFQDAQGLFENMEAKVWHKDRCTIKYWDEEGFNSAEGIKAPLRVLHTEEEEIKRRRIAGKWIEEPQTHSWWWATTIGSRFLSTRCLWEAGHGRWDIENKEFNALVTHWSLNHCFKHDPVAITNFILTLFIAFVLIQTFYQRHLKPQMRTIFTTLIALADEFHVSLGTGTLRTPWLERLTRPPP